GRPLGLPGRLETVRLCAESWRAQAQDQGGGETGAPNAHPAPHAPLAPRKRHAVGRHGPSLALARASPMRSEIWATVGASNTSWTVISAPSLSWILDTIAVATREW